VAAHSGSRAAINRRLVLSSHARLRGCFPYLIIKKTIRRGVGALSPTFVIRIGKS
jgi:hypothetical protein